MTIVCYFLFSQILISDGADRRLDGLSTDRSCSELLSAQYTQSIPPRNTPKSCTALHPSSSLLTASKGNPAVPLDKAGAAPGCQQLCGSRARSGAGAHPATPGTALHQGQPQEELRLQPDLICVWLCPGLLNMPRCCKVILLQRFLQERAHSGSCSRTVCMV